MWNCDRIHVVDCLAAGIGEEQMFAIGAEHEIGMQARHKVLEDSRHTADKSRQRCLAFGEQEWNDRQIGGSLRCVMHL